MKPVLWVPLSVAAIATIIVCATFIQPAAEKNVESNEPVYPVIAEKASPKPV